MTAFATRDPRIPQPVLADNGKVITWDQSLGLFQMAAAGSAGAVVTTTTAYTILAGDTLVLADGTSAAFPVTLPATHTVGQRHRIKRTNTNGNFVSVERAGSALIDGETKIILAQPFDEIEVIGDGTNWNTA